MIWLNGLLSFNKVLLKYLYLMNNLVWCRCGKLCRYIERLNGWGFLKRYLTPDQVVGEIGQ